MKLIKRIGALFGWIVGGTFAAVLLTYAILLLINWRDQPPSASTIKLTQLYQDRHITPDDDNAYVFMLGFSSAPDASPMHVGRDRKAWIREALADPAIETDTDPLATDFDYRSERNVSVANLAEECSTINTACLMALEAEQDTLQAWLNSEQWLLNRYKLLIAHSGFYEEMPYDIRAPLPSYSVILDGQKLLLAQAWKLAGQGDADQVRSMLDQDLIFWRMVLVESDALITKMIATAAISRHFKMANLVIRNIPPDLVLKSVPLSWRNLINKDERSMQRSLVGEWIYADNMIKQSTQGALNLSIPNYEPNEYSLWYYILWKLVEPFWQPQESSNMHAAMMLKLIELFDTPYDKVDDALENAANIDQKGNQTFQRGYNIFGDLLVAQDYTSFARYAVRVSDLEGLRRIAVLSAELRASEIDSDAVAAQLEISDIKNPYTNDSFEWDNELNSIVFTGLELNERGRHSLVY